MGQWFKHFFERHGCTVILSGRKTAVSMEEAAAKGDVVIISVPMDALESVIKRIAPHVRSDALLTDLTSIKEEPIELMLEHSPSEVLGLHPVFGPSVSSMRNQTMVICPGRGNKWQGWLTSLFLKEGAKIKVTSAQKHDKMMSVVQAVTHFSSITMSHVLKELDIDVMESEDFGSPIYKLRMDMVGRILNQEPHLYAHIGTHNPYSEKAIKTYMDTCKELYSVIKKKDVDGFIDYFMVGANYLGEFKDEAQEYSDYIIETLAKKKRKKGELFIDQLDST